MEECERSSARCRTCPRSERGDSLRTWRLAQEKCEWRKLIQGCHRIAWDGGIRTRRPRHPSLPNRGSNATSAPHAPLQARATRKPHYSRITIQQAFSSQEILVLVGMTVVNTKKSFRRPTPVLQKKGVGAGSQRTLFTYVPSVLTDYIICLESKSFHSTPLFWPPGYLF